MVAHVFSSSAQEAEVEEAEFLSSRLAWSTQWQEYIEKTASKKVNGALGV